MIIAVLPLEADFFGDQITGNLVVDVGFVGLAQLVAAGNAVEVAVLQEVGAGLVEAEGHIGRDALLTEGEDPVVVAGAGVRAGFAAHGDFLDGPVQVRREVHGRYERRGDDDFVPDWQGLKDGKPIIGHLLVLHRAAYDDVVVAIGPIVRNAFEEAVYALGEKEELEVAAAAHHEPAFLAPGVRVLEQKVTGEAGEDDFSGLDFPGFVAFALDGEVERTGLAAQAAGHLAAVHLVLPIDIAVLAPRADLGAAVPRVPVGVNFPVFGHYLLDAGLFGGVAALDFLPVDDAPEGFQVVGAAVLIVQVVRVLPDVEG